ncbi:MAG: VOC family protein [Thermoanaerobaculia bacterium]
MTTDPASQNTLEGTALNGSFTVNDINKSLEWYQNVGFTVDQKYDRDGKLVAVSLKAGAARIVIGQDDGAKGWNRKKGEACSLQLTTKQNIDELAARVKAAGVSLAAEPADTPWGSRVFRLKDPDGFTFVISSER